MDPITGPPTKRSKAIEVSKIRHGLYFKCSWEGDLAIEGIIEEARKHCERELDTAIPIADIFVACTPWSDARQARISGRCISTERNAARLGCIRSYLLAHGWKPAEEERDTEERDTTGEMR
jgi:hypothetical protein